MEFDLIELKDKSDVLGVYDIYKHCMYMPTEEKFNRKMNTFLEDDSVKIFACLYQKEIRGIIVISFLEQYKIEIMGIAADSTARNKGIGSYMINCLVDEYGLLSVLAETDNDAVGFYRKNGFDITELSKSYDGETVVRYKCELVK